MTLLFIFMFMAVGISFLCSLLESVLLSSTISYLTMKEESGSATAVLLKKYKLDTERPLAAILSLNTIANTIGAAGVGRQVTILFGNELFGLCSAIFTLLILIFAEIIPKTIGSSYWRSLIGFTAKTIRFLIFLLFPVVLLVELLSRIFKHAETESTFTREEMMAMANVSEEEGVIEKNESKIIQNIIRLENIKAADIMTPRVVAAIAPENMTLKRYYDSDKYDHFSRIPVYKDSPEYITGYVLRDEALEDLTEDNFSITLGEIKRSMPFFNEDTSVSDIFNLMLQQKSQIALIIDQYGCFQGILTLEDIIETVLGFEIVDESDTIADMQQYAKERWQQRQKRYKRLDIKQKQHDK